MGASMKNITKAGLVLAALAAAGPAVAADMPVKAPVAPPVVDPWSGLYFGGNAGYSWGNWDNSNINGRDFIVNGVLTGVASPDVKGWVAGGQVGINQLYGRWLYGVEVDAQATGQHADQSGSFGAVIGDFRVTTTEANRWEMPWFATLRGRVGATVADSWLLYVTGGVAVGHFDYNNTTTVTIATLAGTPVASFAAFNEEGGNRVGGVVGAGIEKAIDAHWRVKAEYLYMDFGSRTFLNGTNLVDDIRLRDNIVRVGFNYRLLP
jgi:outer membrane immunogenic protein